MFQNAQFQLYIVQHWSGTSGWPLGPTSSTTTSHISNAAFSFGLEKRQIPGSMLRERLDARLEGVQIGGETS